MRMGLLITDVKFWTKGAGHKSRIAALFFHLNQYLDLKVVYIGVTEPLDDIAYQNEKLEIIVLEKKAALKPGEYGQKLKDLTLLLKPDFCIIEYLHNSYLLQYLPVGVRTFLDTHDILAHRKESFGRYNYKDDFRDIDSDMEKEIMDLFDYIILISQPDFNYMLGLFPANKLLHVTHAPVTCKRTPRKTVCNIGFIGSEYLPNVEGLTFFAENIFPNIYSDWRIQLIVYGNVCKKISHLSNVDGISLKGFVPDSKVFYDEADIIVNPVRFGAGIKIKNLEAIANCIPLITTSHGATGLEHLKKFILIADDKNGFIAALTKLIENCTLRSEMVSNAFQVISNEFSPHQCYHTLIEAIVR
jgi:glycosyltransferase involved in cell wall biosynthesis